MEISLSLKRCTECKKEKPLGDFERTYKDSLETREFKICNQCAARRLATLRNRRAGAGHVRINHWTDDPWIYLCLTCPLPDCRPYSPKCPINRAKESTPDYAIAESPNHSAGRYCKGCYSELNESNLIKKGDQICRSCKEVRGRKVNERYNARMGSDFRIKHGQTGA